MGHTSEEVREILAALETVYRELFPHLNLRQWSGAIYTWLTQPVLDPTNFGCVTMDYLMKLVITALEWSFDANPEDIMVQAHTSQTDNEDQTFSTRSKPAASHERWARREMIWEVVGGEST